MVVAVAAHPGPGVRQPSLFGGDDPAITDDADLEPVPLAHDAWYVHVPGWLAGDDVLYDHLLATTTWHQHERPMYDRIVSVPRQTASLPGDGPGHPVLDDVVEHLSHRFGDRLDRIGLAHYRDGRDSVAPHGDQVARDRDRSVMATVSLGAPRRFLLTPAAAGSAAPVALQLGRGDLLVMGGTIQRTWRHAVPKTARSVGPRICVMFRPDWMR